MSLEWSGYRDLAEGAKMSLFEPLWVEPWNALRIHGHLAPANFVSTSSPLLGSHVWIS